MEGKKACFVLIIIFVVSVSVYLSFIQGEVTLFIAFVVSFLAISTTLFFGNILSLLGVDRDSQLLSACRKGHKVIPGEAGAFTGLLSQSSQDLLMPLTDEKVSAYWFEIKRQVSHRAQSGAHIERLALATACAGLKLKTDRQFFEIQALLDMRGLPGQRSTFSEWSDAFQAWRQNQPFQNFKPDQGTERGDLNQLVSNTSTYTYHLLGNTSPVPTDKVFFSCLKDGGEVTLFGQLSKDGHSLEGLNEPDGRRIRIFEGSPTQALIKHKANVIKAVLLTGVFWGILHLVAIPIFLRLGS